MQTDTLLREENRTTVIKLDSDRRAQHQRRGNQQRESRPNDIQQAFNHVRRIRILRQTCQQYRLFGRITQVQAMTAHICQRHGQRKLHAKRFDRKRNAMQHFGITGKHVGNVHFLRTQAFARTRESGIERNHLQLIGTLNGRIRIERRDHIGVFLVAVGFDRAHGNRRIPPIGVILHGTQRTIDAVGRADHHGLILAGTLLTTAMLPLTHLPARNHFQEKCDDRSDDKRGSRQRKIENKRKRAVGDDGEQRCVNDFRIQLVTFRHHMAMIRSGKSEAQHPNQTEADEEQPERHDMDDGIICGIVGPKTDGQRNQHDRKIDHHQAGDKGITPCGHDLVPLALVPSIFTNGKWRVRKRHRLELRAVALRSILLLLLTLMA